MSARIDRGPPNRCYRVPTAAKVNEDLYLKLSASSRENIVQKFTVPKQRGQAWELKAGQTCRFVVAYGSQVGDVNLWNLHNFKEYFYSGKTRQIHRNHLTTFDRLWSTTPYMNPMATVTANSLADYGFDEYGGGVHDVTGTRCDPYIRKLITGQEGGRSCHGNIAEAIAPWGLSEHDVHDVFNIFMCTGFTVDTHEYFVRASPAQKGDYIEIFAEMDLLVALSVCPYGDVSIPVGEEVPDSICFPLDVEISEPSGDLLEQWRQAGLADLNQMI